MLIVLICLFCFVSVLLSVQVLFLISCVYIFGYSYVGVFILARWKSLVVDDIDQYVVVSCNSFSFAHDFCFVSQQVVLLVLFFIHLACFERTRTGIEDSGPNTNARQRGSPITMRSGKNINVVGIPCSYPPKNFVHFLIFRLPFFS